jgi:uncharacterized SAM-binding protein YcdF (DUF218 family)
MRGGRRLGRAAFGLAAALCLLALAGLGGFLGFVFSLDRVERDPPGRADGIVALTGGAQRIGDAIELLARGYAGRLLITGVNERTRREEIARLSPGQRRLVECCVDLDYRARNTVGNAEETRRWARENGFRSLIVVTSNYHMPRSMAELEAALPEVRKVPHPVVTPAVDPAGWWASLSATRLLAGEYAKYVMVAIRTRLGAPKAAGAPERDNRRATADELARR